jgi:hypothetical protein
MSVNHGGLDVPVSHQLLDSSNVAALLQEMCGKRMPQYVTGDRLLNSG